MGDDRNTKLLARQANGKKGKEEGMMYELRKFSES